MNTVQRSPRRVGLADASASFANRLDADAELLGLLLEERPGAAAQASFMAKSTTTPFSSR